EIITRDPMDGVETPAEVKTCERVLTDAELAQVWKAAEKMGWPFGPCVQLLILTAQRRSEVSGMTWSEVDLGDGLWSLPSTRTKNKRAHEVPLPTTAIEILRALPTYGQRDYVFTTDQRVPIAGFSGAKGRLDQTMLEARAPGSGVIGPIPHWTFHSTGDA